MSYVSISPSLKVKAVKLYWQTNNLSATAEEFNISRATLYEWIRLAEENLEKIFLASKPGKRTVTTEQENQKLRDQLRDVTDAYHKLSQSQPSPRPPSPVAACPRCGSVNLVRNGRVFTKRDGLRQRLWCRPCRLSIYVEVKKTL